MRVWDRENEKKVEKRQKATNEREEKKKGKPLVFNSFNCVTHTTTLYANEIFTIHWAYTMAQSVGSVRIISGTVC